MARYRVLPRNAVSLSAYYPGRGAVAAMAGDVFDGSVMTPQKLKKMLDGGVIEKVSNETQVRISLGSGTFEAAQQAKEEAKKG